MDYRGIKNSNEYLKNAASVQLNRAESKKHNERLSDCISEKSEDESVGRYQ